jgi:4-amino-4-deoxy-L-arabinose transferase-like glycosyltransferase
MKTNSKIWIAKYLPTIVAVTLILIFTVQNIAFICQDTGSFLNDNHYFRALDFYFSIFQKTDTVYYPDLVHNPFPPLVNIIVTPFFALFGTNLVTARIAAQLFWIVFLISMYLIGKETEDEWSGIIVLCFAASSPHILNNSRNFFPDLPQAALSALSLLYLIKSKSFALKNYALLSGLFFGLAVLCKWSAVFSMAAPFMLYFALALFRERKNILFIIPMMFPVIMAALGYYLLYSNCSTGKADETQWFSYYSGFIIIPSLIIIVAMIFVKKLPACKDEFIERSSNAVLAFITVNIVSGWWFCWAVDGVLLKLKLDGMDIAAFTPQLSNFINFFISMFCSPLLWILPFAGILCLFTKRFPEKRINIIIIILSALFFILFCIKTTLYRDTRYVLFLVVFISILAGWGFVFTGRFKKAILSIVIIAALSSVLWWLMPINPGNAFTIVGSTGFFKNRKTPSSQFFVASEPDKTKIETENIINFLINNGQNQISNRRILINNYVKGLSFRDQLYYEICFLKKLKWEIREINGIDLVEEPPDSKYFKDLEEDDVIVAIYKKKDADEIGLETINTNKIVFEQTTKFDVNDDV